MRALVLIFLMAALPVASGTLPPTEADYWAAVPSVGKTDFLERFVSNEVCRRSQDHYNACLKALNSAHSTLLAAGLEAATAARLTSTKEPVDFNAEIDALNGLGDRVPKAMLFGKMALNVLLYFDPHAHLAPTAMMNYQISNSPDILETGLQVEISGLGVFVRRVYPGTPAAEAGVAVNDEIVSIDGETLGSGLQAQNLWWQHGRVTNRAQVYEINRGGQILKTSLRPTHLSIPNIGKKILRVGGQRIAWLSVRYFTTGTCDELNSALLEGRRDGVHGYVIDLRGNFGGVLQEGVCAASLFVGGVTVMDHLERSPRFPIDYGLKFLTYVRHTERDKQRQAPTSENEPVIVLQNASTASASEVFSSAIQDYRRGWIVGEKSMGKGSTQILTSLGNYDGLTIGYTNAENLRASGASLQLNGVTPDFRQPFVLGGGPGSENFLREPDFSPGYFLPKKLVAWRQTRPQEQRKISDCAAIQQVSSIERLRRQIGYEDNQLAYALAVFSCR